MRSNNSFINNSNNSKLFTNYNNKGTNFEKANLTINERAKYFISKDIYQENINYRINSPNFRKSNPVLQDTDEYKNV